MQQTERGSNAPGPAPAPGGRDDEPPARRGTALRELIFPVRWSLRAAVLLQIGASAMTVVPYLAIAELARAFLGGTPEPRAVWGIVGISVLALLMRALLGGAAVIVTHLADARLQRVLRGRLTRHLERLPLAWFTRSASGLVRKTVQDDVREVHYRVAHGAIDTAAAVTVPVTALGCLVLMDWRLALVGIATLPLYGIASLVMVRTLRAQTHEMNAGIERISASIVEFVSGIAVLKIFGRAGAAQSSYRRAALEFSSSYARWTTPMIRLDALASIPLSAPIMLLIVLSAGTWFVHLGWVDLVAVLTAAMLAVTLPVAIITVTFAMQKRREAAAAAERMTALMRIPPLREAESPRSPTSFEVRFDGVSFAYEPETPVLRHVSATLPAGSVTALVGPSGSGKSTLAAVLARFEDVSEGTVTIGGVDLRDIASTELYRSLGLVLQDVHLLRMSVLDNIRLGRPQAPVAEVRRAATLAQIDTRLQRLPRGYDSVVGEDARLSGGEAQRLSIARALLTDPPILVLDEATSFADAESESKIQRALSTLATGRTVLVIAHRLDSIVGVDQILVLENGTITASGTHRELMARPGWYRRMRAADARDRRARDTDGNGDHA